MTFPDDISPRDWQALVRAARGQLGTGPADAGAVRRLVRLHLVTEAQGAPALTPGGRGVLVRGSPALWSLSA